MKRSVKRGHDARRAHSVVEKMRIGGHPPIQHRPHKLKGGVAGLWECHIAPDWLLIYEMTDNTVVLYRTGSHADVFE